MKKDGMYRFNLQFGASSVEEIRVGEFLESLGHKKSAVLIQALIEFLNHHPEFESGDRRRSIQINKIPIGSLEDEIRRLIEERLSGIDIASLSNPAIEEAATVSQDIVDMLGDLDLFTF